MQFIENTVSCRNLCAECDKFVSLPPGSGQPLAFRQLLFMETRE